MEEFVMQIKMLVIIFLYIITIASGIVLSKFGRPLNNLIFTIHKLIAVAFTVVNFILFFNLIKTSVGGTELIILIIVSALFVLILFVSGALLSFDKMATKNILIIHNISMVMLLISSVATIYFLVVKK